MPDDDVELGHAAGWQVEETADGRFTWTAYGPRGSRRGHAETRAEAEEAARLAERELSEPRSTP